MGCKQSKEGPKIDKDVEVRRKLQVGLHLAKDEDGFQIAFGKTSRKKYGQEKIVVDESPTEAEEENNDLGRNLQNESHKHN